MFKITNLPSTYSVETHNDVAIRIETQATVIEPHTVGYLQFVEWVKETATQDESGDWQLTCDWGEFDGWSDDLNDLICEIENFLDGYGVTLECRDQTGEIVE